MAEGNNNVSGKAKIDGEPILTAPTGSTVTIFGLAAFNTDPENIHEISLDIDGDPICPPGFEVVNKGGYDFMDGSKYVLESGQTLTAVGDTDNDISIFVSYLEEV